MIPFVLLFLAQGTIPPTSSDYVRRSGSPAAAQCAVWTSDGKLGGAACASGGGTVTNVVFPSSIFDQVTASGTITATIKSQSANLFFASPNGSAGAASMRAIVAADVPTLTLSKITPCPDGQIPIPAAGAWACRVLADTDIPSLDAAKITSGTFNAARIPSLDTSKITSGVFTTAFLPIQGGGSLVPSTNGLTASRCVETDANNRLVSTSTACGSGGGSGYSAIEVNGTAVTPARSTLNVLGGTGMLATGSDVSSKTVLNFTPDTSVFPTHTNVMAGGDVTCSSTGTNTQTCTLTTSGVQFTSYPAWVKMCAASANTGAATIVLSALTGIDIQQWGGAALTNGLIAANRCYPLTYQPSIPAYWMPATGGGASVTKVRWSQPIVPFVNANNATSAGSGFATVESASNAVTWTAQTKRLTNAYTDALVTDAAVKAYFYTELAPAWDGSPVVAGLRLSQGDNATSATNIQINLKWACIQTGTDISSVAFSSATTGTISTPNLNIIGEMQVSFTPTCTAPAALIIEAERATDTFTNNFRFHPSRLTYYITLE